MGALTHNGEIMQGLPANASQINFDKTGTDLDATQAEAAIKEVNGKVNTNAEDINQLKSGLTNLVKVYHANATTDSVGDFIFSVPSNGTLVYVRPLRDAEYYNSWWGVILASAGNNVAHSAKAIKDDNTALTSQAVKFDVYYI